MIEELEFATIKLKNKKLIPYTIVKEVVQALQNENKEMQDLILDMPTTSNNNLTMKFSNANTEMANHSTYQLNKKSKLELIRMYRVLQGRLKRKDNVLIDRIAELRVTNKKLSLTTYKLNKLSDIYEKRSYKNMKVKK